MVEAPITKTYDPFKLKNLMESIEELTQQALAIEYAKMGLSIFPCNLNKTPLIDFSLEFSRGFRDATIDLKLIAKTWHKYKDAGIGLALPEDIIVIDCDILKDAEKKPILKDGGYIMIGMNSLLKLLRQLSIDDAVLGDTLAVKTQSGGRHFYYRMPQGVASFNHPHALEGLDLKGRGGYVLLPPSQGQHGKYEFQNFYEIKEIPGPLLEWVKRFNGATQGNLRIPNPGSGKIDTIAIIEILKPYWARADGLRNEFTLDLAGFIARSGGTVDQALFIVSELARLTGKGADHIAGARYAFNRTGKLRGFSSLDDLLWRIEDDKE